MLFLDCGVAESHHVCYGVENQSSTSRLHLESKYQQANHQG